MFIPNWIRMRAANLKIEHVGHKTGMLAGWIGSILVLILFPPLGIFLTGWCLIVSIREAGRETKAAAAAAKAVAEAQARMPKN